MIPMMRFFPFEVISINSDSRTPSSKISRSGLLLQVKWGRISKATPPHELCFLELKKVL